MRREALIIKPEGDTTTSHESLHLALGYADIGDRIVMKSITGSITMYYVGLDRQLHKQDYSNWRGDLFNAISRYTAQPENPYKKKEVQE